MKVIFYKLAKYFENDKERKFPHEVPVVVSPGIACLSILKIWILTDPKEYTHKHEGYGHKNHHLLVPIMDKRPNNRKANDSKCAEQLVSHPEPRSVFLSDDFRGINKACCGRSNDKKWRTESKRSVNPDWGSTRQKHKRKLLRNWNSFPGYKFQHFLATFNCSDFSDPFLYNSQTNASNKNGFSSSNSIDNRPKCENSYQKPCHDRYG